MFTGQKKYTIRCVKVTVYKTIRYLIRQGQLYMPLDIATQEAEAGVPEPTLGNIA